jgi:hypothetical protein
MKPLSTTSPSPPPVRAIPLPSPPKPPPLRFDIYVRGAFNGWGTDNQLAWKGKGIYETDILVSPGNHAFKIGSKDWNAEWVANPSASVAVALGTAYPLATEAGPEDYLFTKQTAASASASTSRTRRSRC